MIAYVLNRLFATPWTVALQASLPLGFSRQEYWNGLPFHPSGDLPNPGIKSMSSELASRFFTTESPWKPQYKCLPLGKREGKKKREKENKSYLFGANP